MQVYGALEFICDPRNNRGLPIIAHMENALLGLNFRIRNLTNQRSDDTESVLLKRT